MEKDDDDINSSDIKSYRYIVNTIIVFLWFVIFYLLLERADLIKSVIMNYIIIGIMIFIIIGIPFYFTWFLFFQKK